MISIENEKKLGPQIPTQKDDCKMSFKTTPKPAL